MLISAELYAVSSLFAARPHKLPRELIKADGAVSAASTDRGPSLSGPRHTSLTIFTAIYCVLARVESAFRLLYSRFPDDVTASADKENSGHRFDTATRWRRLELQYRRNSVSHTSPTPPAPSHEPRTQIAYHRHDLSSPSPNAK